MLKGYFPYLGGELDFFPVSEKEAREIGLKNRLAINEETEFPRRLKRLREEKGETLAVASSEIGITRSTLGLYEKGENVPDVKTLVRIAHHYGATVNYLLGEDMLPTHDMNYVFEMTGLSEKAISKLAEYKRSENEADQLINNTFGKLLSDFIVSEQMLKLKKLHKDFDEYISIHYMFRNFEESNGELLKRAIKDDIDYVDKLRLSVLFNSVDGVSDKTNFELSLIAAKYQAMNIYGDFFENCMKKSESFERD